MVAKLPKLTRLVVVEADLTDAGLDALAGAAALRVLQLGQVKVTTPAVIPTTGWPGCGG